MNFSECSKQFCEMSSDLELIVHGDEETVVKNTSSITKQIKDKMENNGLTAEIILLANDKNTEGSVLNSVEKAKEYAEDAEEQTQLIEDMVLSAQPLAYQLSAPVFTATEGQTYFPVNNRGILTVEVNNVPLTREYTVTSTGITINFPCKDKWTVKILYINPDSIMLTNNPDLTQIPNTVMLVTQYDSDGDGIVDYAAVANHAKTADSSTNADKVNSHTVEKNVPSNAIFTDTTYNVGNGGLTERNFTQTLENKVNAIPYTNGTRTDDEGVTVNDFRCRRDNNTKIVMLYINASLGTDTSSSLICTLEEGFRPDIPISGIGFAFDAGRVFTVEANGGVYMNRDADDAQQAYINISYIGN